MLHSVGLYLPNENTFIDYTDIISDFDKNVNIDIFKSNELDTINKFFTPYSENESDELNKLFNISLKLNEQNFNLYPFNDTIYKHTEFALSEAFRNNQIAKIVEPGILESCSLCKDLSIISEADNLKYPYIQIQWSDIEHFKNSDCLSINTAQEQFDIANQTAEDGTKSTSFSLHLSDSEIFNFKYVHSPQGQEILEYIKSHLDEMQTDQAMSKSLTALNSYISSQTTAHGQLNHQATQSLDSFDATEYPL